MPKLKGDYKLNNNNDGNKKFNKLYEEAKAIEALEAQEAKQLGFTTRSLVQTTLPHSKPMKETKKSEKLRLKNPDLKPELEEDKSSSFIRENGNAKLLVIPNPILGLPYGNIPRILIAWLSTEAIRKKERQIQLGNNLSDFLRELDLSRAGSNISRLRDQMNRLFSCSIQSMENSETPEAFIDTIEKADIAEKYESWWSKKTDYTSLFNSYVILSEKFFNDVVKSPIPIDLRVIKAIRSSSLALDIYCWVTYKNSFTRQPIAISWELLQLQFGAGYPMTSQGKQNFKQMFIKTLRDVAVVYPEAGKLQTEKDYLLFIPGKPSISKQNIPKQTGD